jgi:hypothetical protein
MGRSVFVKSRILLDELLFIFGQIVEGMDRIGPAGGDASAAVDASLGIDVHLSSGFKLGLVLLRVDAIGGADLDAKGILDAGISNYISHDESISRMK